MEMKLTEMIEHMSMQQVAPHDPQRCFMRWTSRDRQSRANSLILFNVPEARINIQTEIVNGERGHYLVWSVRVNG